MFIALMPKWVPGRPFLVYISGLVELLLAVGLWQEQWHKLAAQGTLGLMLLFLPLHVVDMFRERPDSWGKVGNSRAAPPRPIWLDCPSRKSWLKKNLLLLPKRHIQDQKRLALLRAFSFHLRRFPC